MIVDVNSKRYNKIEPNTDSVLSFLRAETKQESLQLAAHFVCSQTTATARSLRRASRHHPHTAEGAPFGPIRARVLHSSFDPRIAYSLLLLLLIFVAVIVIVVVD